MFVLFLICVRVVGVVVLLFLVCRVVFLFCFRVVVVLSCVHNINIARRCCLARPLAKIAAVTTSRRDVMFCFVVFVVFMVLLLFMFVGVVVLFCVCVMFL